MFPWAAGGNLRDLWEMDPPQQLDTDFLAWAFTQLSGLASAVEKLHSPAVNCRHGDLKPENILCFENKHCVNSLAQPWLVISDVGLATYHTEATEFRDMATRTLSGTAMYEAPEAVIFRNKARSRRYDIWSIGCLYLEFLIWILYGKDQLRRFRKDLEAPDMTRRFFEIVGPGTAVVRRCVQKWADWISRDPRCSQTTAISRFLQLIRSRLLVVEVSEGSDGIPPTQGRATNPQSLDSIHGIVLTVANTSDGPEVLPRATASELDQALREIVNDASSSNTQTEWIDFQKRSPGGPIQYGTTLAPSESRGNRTRLEV